MKNYFFYFLIFISFITLVFFSIDVLSPFIISFLIAYLLNPIANWFEKKGINRSISSILIIILFILLITILLSYLLPIIYYQIYSFITSIPSYFKVITTKLLPKFSGYHIDTSNILSTLKNNLSSYGDDIAISTGTGLKSLLFSGFAFIDIISYLVLIPFISYYFIKDFYKLCGTFMSLIPIKFKETTKELFKRINTVLSGYVKGQFIVILIMATYYSISLTLIGLKEGFLIGILTGIFTILPYIGPSIFLVISLVVSYIQSGSWSELALILCIFSFGQFTEGNFIVPKLVGDKVNLSPLWVIFAMLAGGHLFGFAGLIIAIPLTAVVGVAIRMLLQSYKNSKLYLE